MGRARKATISSCRHRVTYHTRWRVGAFMRQQRQSSAMPVCLGQDLKGVGVELSPAGHVLPHQLVEHRVLGREVAAQHGGRVHQRGAAPIVGSPVLPVPLPEGQQVQPRRRGDRRRFLGQADASPSSTSRVRAVTAAPRRTTPAGPPRCVRWRPPAQLASGVHETRHRSGAAPDLSRWEKACDEEPLIRVAGGVGQVPVALRALLCGVGPCGTDGKKMGTAVCVNPRCSPKECR